MKTGLKYTHKVFVLRNFQTMYRQANKYNFVKFDNV